MRIFLGLGRYIGLIVSFGLFLILIAAILVFNVYSSYQIEKNSHAIQLAARQGVLLQNILVDLYEVEQNLIQNNDYLASIEALHINFSQFDEALDAFVYGGELIGLGQGQDNLLSNSGKVQRKLDKALLSEIAAIWKDYRVLLSNVVYATYKFNVDRQETFFKTQLAFEYGRNHNKTLQPLLRDFTLSVEKVVQTKTERLRLVQTLGIFLAMLYFVFLLIYLTKRLVLSDRQIARAQGETQEILQTVEQGLLLIGADYRIGGQYSKSLNSIFNRHQFEGVDFLQFMEPMISQKTFETAKSYVDMLFKPYVKENLVEDLNPFDEIEVQIESEQGGFQTRYLSLGFKRVIYHKKIRHLLVTVNDITTQVELKKKLEFSEQKSTKELELMMTLLSMNPEEAGAFLARTEHTLVDINNYLKAPCKTKSEYAEKARDLYRMAHKLKGECGLMQMDFLMENVHDLESMIQLVIDNNEVTGEDFLPITYQLKELMNKFDSLNELLGRIKTFAKQSSPNMFANAQASIAGKGQLNAKVPISPMQLHSLAINVAEDMSKQVTTKIDICDLACVPDDQVRDARDLLVQLIRNAVVHGIELPSIRTLQGKQAQGLLKIKVRIVKGELRLSVSDDGAGLNGQAIREKAIAQGLVSMQEADQLSNKKLAKLLFSTGMTTLDSSNLHGGRGVGLDLVKNLVRQNSGKISVLWEKQVYTEFRIRLPLVLQSKGSILSEPAIAEPALLETVSVA